MKSLPEGIEFSRRRDAKYDKATGEWLEEVCGNSECEFCAGRPDNAFEEDRYEPNTLAH